MTFGCGFRELMNMFGAAQLERLGWLDRERGIMFPAAPFLCAAFQRVLYHLFSLTGERVFTWSVGLCCQRPCFFLCIYFF